MLTLEPIGIVHSPYVSKYDAPRQPGVDDRRHEAVVELMAGRNFEQALEDMAGIERIWIVSWFHRATTWKPKVLPPRSTHKRGLFATRSPHRPNPIGLSVARIVAIDGLRITIAETDLLDGTPVLDIKPYIPYADSFPGSAAGWVDDDVRSAVFNVHVDHDVHVMAPADVLDHARRVLALDPDPHPYRRTSMLPDGRRMLAIRQWRLIYVVDGHDVHIKAIVIGDSNDEMP